MVQTWLIILLFVLNESIESGCIEAVNWELNKPFTIDPVQDDSISLKQNFERKLHYQNVNINPLKCPEKGFDGEESTPWGYEVLGLKNVDDSNIDKIKICLIDSGFDSSHADFQGLKVTYEAVKLTDPDFRNNPYYSFLSNKDLIQFRNITLDPTLGIGDKDWAGTGTASLGVIAAVHNNGIGTHGIIKNQNVKIHVVKGVSYGLYYQGQPTEFGTSITGAVERCMKVGAKVIIISSAVPGGYQEEESKYFEDLSKKNVLVFAPTGFFCSGFKPCAIPFYAYPASYKGVVAVTAMDSNFDFVKSSAWNYKIDFTGPGSRYLTTIPYSPTSVLSNFVGVGSCVSLNIQPFNLTVPGSLVWGSKDGNVTGLLKNCTFGDELCENVINEICFISPGGYSNLFQKALNCQKDGAAAALLYGQDPNLDMTFSLGKNYANISIPVVVIDYSSGIQIGQLMSNNLLTANLSSKIVGYKYITNPYVSNAAVAAATALVWSNFPLCNNSEIISAMRSSALPLTPTGVSPYFGYGLPQADKAVDYLNNNPCIAY